MEGDGRGRTAGPTAGQVGLPAEKFYPRGRISDSSRREKWGTKDGRQEINSETTMTANASLNADSFRERWLAVWQSWECLRSLDAVLSHNFFLSFFSPAFPPSFKGAEIGSQSNLIRGSPIPLLLRFSASEAKAAAPRSREGIRHFLSSRCTLQLGRKEKRKEGRGEEGGSKQRRRRQQLDFVVPWKFPPAIINHDKAPLVVDGGRGGRGGEGRGGGRGGEGEEQT